VGIMQRELSEQDVVVAILKLAMAIEAKQAKATPLMAALDKVDQQFRAGSAHPPRFLPDA
jgi:hypothetical protein